MSSPLVLLVDPDEQDRILVRGLLEELGYEVTPCADPRAALVTLAHTPHAVILTAYPLPTNGGGDFVSALQQIAPDTPVMGMIRRGMREVARDALTHGCREFVSKPVDPELLAGLLKSVLLPVGEPVSGVPVVEVAPTPAETLEQSEPRGEDRAGETPSDDPSAPIADSPEITPQ